MDKKLEVGKTYNTAAGPAECIYVQGDLAWMRAYGDATAYVWTLDGKAVSLATDDGCYDVIWEEPMTREEIETRIAALQAKLAAMPKVETRRILGADKGETK